MVECTALEMRHTGNRIGGSNPSLSANYPYSPEFATGRQKSRSAENGAVNHHLLLFTHSPSFAIICFVNVD